MIQVSTQDLLRLHSDRIAVSCIADLFAIAEVELPGSLAGELRAFTQRVSREFLDLPEGNARMEFLAELSALDPVLIPHTLRRAIEAFGAHSSEAVKNATEKLLDSWKNTPPASVRLPRPPPRSTSASTPEPVRKVEEPKKIVKTPRPRTPAALVDTVRVEWIRNDVMERLKTREYADRGLKESVLIAGCQHRGSHLLENPHKNLTEEEIRAELRRLEREQKVKHAGDRWVIR